MKNVSFAFLLVFTLASVAQSEEWTVQTGELKYHVHFVLKEVQGTSQNVKGKGVCEGEVCEFLIAAPVKSFESGDTNRDIHMLEVTKASQYPLVSAKISVNRQKSDQARVEVNFAGKSKVYEKVPVKIQRTGDHSHTATGVLPIHMADFSLERPSLLGMKIDDNIEIDFSLVLKN